MFEPYLRQSHVRGSTSISKSPKVSFAASSKKFRKKLVTYVFLPLPV